MLTIEYDLSKKLPCKTPNKTAPILTRSSNPLKMLPKINNLTLAIKLPKICQRIINSILYKYIMLLRPKYDYQML